MRDHDSRKLFLILFLSLISLLFGSFYLIPSTSSVRDVFVCSSSLSVSEPSDNLPSSERYSVKGLAFVVNHLNLVYVDNPKAATTSIRGAMKAMKSITVRDWFSFPKVREYFVFSFVRNPLMRLASAYSTISSRAAVWIPPLATNQVSGFKVPWFEYPLNSSARFSGFLGDVLRAEQVSERQEGTNFLPFFPYNHSKIEYEMHHSLPQTFYTSDHSGKAIKIDFLGRIESFEDDWDSLRKEVMHRNLEHIKGEDVDSLLPFPPKKNVHEGTETDTFYYWLISLFENGGEGGKVGALIKLLCNFYLNDFRCLGYPFPRECGKLK